MSAKALPPTLQYAAPRIFFRGECSYRRGLTLFGMFVMAGFGVACVYCVGKIQGNDWSVTYGRTVTGMFAAGCFIVSGFFGWAWATRYRSRGEINEDGVVVGKRLVSWQVITSFIGSKTAAGIEPYFWVEGGVLPRGLILDPKMTDDEFEQLIQELEPFLRKRFPNVEVKPEPVWESSS